MTQDKHDHDQQTDFGQLYVPLPLSAAAAVAGDRRLDGHGPSDDRCIAVGRSRQRRGRVLKIESRRRILGTLRELLQLPQDGDVQDDQENVGEQIVDEEVHPAAVDLNVEFVHPHRGGHVSVEDEGRRNGLVGEDLTVAEISDGHSVTILAAQLGYVEVVC